MVLNYDDVDDYDDNPGLRLKLENYQYLVHLLDPFNSFLLLINLFNLII